MIKNGDVPLPGGLDAVPAREICVFTAARSEYGLLRPVLSQLRSQGANSFLLVTGSHLSASQGRTVSDIDGEDLHASEGVEMLLDADTPAAVCASAGLGIIRFADVFSRRRPNLLVLLGDRFETLAAAFAASVFRIPVAHIHGGELTFGAIDDAFRHAITKMSHLHFASTAGHRDRIVQMGEQPSRVFDVGALGVENALKLDLFSREEVAARVGLPEGTAYIVATFHPSNLDNIPSLVQLQAVLDAINRQEKFFVVLTASNADEKGTQANNLLARFASERPGKVKLVTSLGTRLYLSAAKHSAMVLGNSSSGLIEVPSLQVPTVNIGTRQDGRTRAASVLDVPAETDAILAAIDAVDAGTPFAAARFRNPYEGRDTAATIAAILCSFPLDGVKKAFADVALARAPASEPR